MSAIFVLVSKRRWSCIRSPAGGPNRASCCVEMKRATRLVAVIAMLSLMAGVACSSKANKATTKKTLKIAFLGALTGDNAQLEIQHQLRSRGYAVVGVPSSDGGALRPSSRT